MAGILFALDNYIDLSLNKFITLTLMVTTGLIVYGLGIITTQAVKPSELKTFLSRKKT
jgi:hypothetical protein